MSRGLTLIVVGAVCAVGCGRSALAPSSVEPLLGAGGSSLTGPRIAVTNFVAFGDSITWGEDGRNDASEPLDLIRTRVRVSDPYPTLLAYYLQTRNASQPITVFNAGARGEPAGGGDSGPSGTTLARFDSVVIGGAYQSVLLMEGANDIGDGEDGIPAGVSGLRNMIDDAKSHGIRVFLATIPPEQQNANPIPFSRNIPESVVLAMNAQIRSLAASESVSLVDIYSAFPSPDTNDLYALGLLSRDGLHPLQGGYELIAHTFLDEIVHELDLPPKTATPTKTGRGN